MAKVDADKAQYFFKAKDQEFDVLGFNAHEEMSNLFRFTLTLWSDDPEVDVKSLLRQEAQVTVAWDEEDPKEKTYFGVVASISQTDAGIPGEVEEEYGIYSCVVVPSLWLLGQQTNCRIFKNMTTPKILEEVLNKGGMAGKFDPNELTASYVQREFCVQYRETDLAFISRLMEEEGIFYWFHHEGGEKMMLGDSPNAYGKCWPQDTAEFHKRTEELEPGDEFIFDLVYEENAHIGKIEYKSYDYEKPGAALSVEQKAEQNDDLGVYDYHPERYVKDSHGDALAKAAVEAQAAMAKTLTGSGNWRSLSSGCLVTLDKTYREDLKGEWLVVSSSHDASQEAEAGVNYSVSFTAVPADITCRPKPRTPRPYLNLQTATVVGLQTEGDGEKEAADTEGSAGETASQVAGSEKQEPHAYMDDKGRAMVKFHWDKEGKSSIPIRVTQQYAGIDEATQNIHGFQWHPLIGDEVVVEFLEGDPDRPLIVGSVYNAERMPPIKMKELVRNVIQTRYQHKLVMDDFAAALTLETPYSHRLKLDDASVRATLTTNGGHHLTMQDLKMPEEAEPNPETGEVDPEAIPTVTLSTTARQTLHLEDMNEDRGNNLKLSTNEGHFLEMVAGEEMRAIRLRSAGGHRMLLDDFAGQVRIRSRRKHSIVMQDAVQVEEGEPPPIGITVTSRQGHRIEINEDEQFIEISDSEAKHHFKIDMENEKITLETLTGDIDVLAPEGTFKLDANAVEITAATHVKINGTDIESEASKDFKVQAMKIEEKASTDLKMKAMNISSEASMKNVQKGTMTSTEASAINTVKGGLVKVN